MKNYILKNYRTYLSILLSLFIVLFIVPIFFTPGKLTSLISRIKIPEFNSRKLFTLNFGTPDVRNGFKPFPTYGSPTSGFQFGGSPSPTDVQTRHAASLPTTNQTPTPTVRNGFKPFPTKIQSPTKIPTKIPTVTPKPTRAPDIFPIDQSLVRQGTTSDEVFAIASQKTCVPKEVLKAVAYIESGQFFSVVPQKYFLLYNSYNWWNSQYLTDVKRACGGYDFANATGIIPTDSKYAGHNCHSDGSTSLEYSTIMGPMQITIALQDKFAKSVASVLGVKQIDRRVILDSLLIAGFSMNYNVKPSSCSNWSGREIVKAACSYYGSCGFADGSYYCNTFCRNYKSFGGKGSCDAASFGDNCWQ